MRSDPFRLKWMERSFVSNDALPSGGCLRAVLRLNTEEWFRGYRGQITQGDGQSEANKGLRSEEKRESVCSLI
jgi:hypothetical protein